MGKKIFSGVQPSGNLHLGNYIGAIKNFVELQNEKENSCVYCVVDLHAITVKQDPNILKNNIKETTAFLKYYKKQYQEVGALLSIMDISVLQKVG